MVERKTTWWKQRMILHVRPHSLYNRQYSIDVRQQYPAALPTPTVSSPALQHLCFLLYFTASNDNNNRYYCFCAPSGHARLLYSTAGRRLAQNKEIVQHYFFSCNRQRLAVNLVFSISANRHKHPSTEAGRGPNFFSETVRVADSWTRVLLKAAVRRTRKCRLPRQWRCVSVCRCAYTSHLLHNDPPSIWRPDMVLVEHAVSCAYITSTGWLSVCTRQQR